MHLKDSFIKEFQHEAIATKKILERVPMEKASWQPHERSMTLGRLATHVADIPLWVSRILNIHDYDFMKHPYQTPAATSSEELMKIFQESLDEAVTELGKIDDDYLSKRWTVSVGDKLMYDLTKKIAVRSWGCNHLYHHRGQLSVFLRLLDIPVPGMYGPSADER